MVVVPQDLLDALRYNQQEKMGPIGHQLSSLDNQMRTILSSELPDDKKAQQYFQTMEKYTTLKDIAKKPPTTAAINPSPDPTYEKSSDQLNEIPIPQQKKAEKVFNWLDRVAPNITWNEKGEVEGIPGSNIADLVTSLANPKSRRDPRGFSEFAELLQAANIPRTLVANNQHWDNYFTPITPDPHLLEDDIYATPKSTPAKIAKSKKKKTPKRQKTSHLPKPQWLTINR